MQIVLVKIKDFCYLIYKDFSNHYNLLFKSKDEFYDDLKRKLFHSTYFYKQKVKSNIHTFLFFCIIFILIVAYYFFKK